MQKITEEDFFKLKKNQNNDKNHSCPPALQEDITMSRNQAQIFRRAKSQIINQINKINQKEDRNIKQGQQKIIKKPQKPVSQKNLDRKILQKYEHGTQFDVQKVQSQQCSDYQGSINSRSNKEYKKQKQKQKINDIQQKKINVLIAGAADTGKTTFIKCFKNKQRKSQNPIIRSRTKQLRQQAGIVDKNHLDKRSNVNFIDFPGFQQKQINNYLKDIQTYAAQKSLKKQIQHNKLFQDERIHCCLYFLQGPNIKQTDLFVMNQLAQIFTLIPIIAKSDCYTIQQILQFKDQFRIKIQNKLARKILDIQDLVGQLLGPKQKLQMLRSQFGNFPPFAIASSCQRQINGSFFIRKYPWGKVQIDNQKHTDFSKLSYLLTDLLKNAIISKTTKVQLPKSVPPIQFPEQQRNQKYFGPLIAVGLMTFCLGFYVAHIKKQ